MITEVQIGKSLLHLMYLRKIVHGIAVGLGMCRKDVEETEAVVNEVCLSSIDSAVEPQFDNLSIKLIADGELMTVEITDRSAGLDHLREAGWGSDPASLARLDSICQLVDRVEFIRESEGTTIRITKSASQPTAALIPHLPVLETTAV